MANMEYVTDNKLTAEADQQKNASRKTIMILGMAIAVGALFIHIYASLFVLFLTLIAWASQNGSETLRSGAIGEDIALKILSGLPRTFTIYNQVDIPNAKSKTGFNEADLIVVGPNAVFIIEVKHNNSQIVGSENDNEWTVKKVGRGGTAYSKTMRNPISQVKMLVWLLSEDMKKKKSRAWIQGVVLFSNNDAEVKISGTTSLPILRNNEIIDYIQSYETKSNISNISKVTQSIADLKVA
jgi:hypothetical protein